MPNNALPNRNECLALIRDCHVPAHIVRHSKVTATFAAFLARRLVESGVFVDVELVERACLLHDLFRVCEFPLQDFSGFEQPVTEYDKVRWVRLKEQHGRMRHEDAACAYLRDAYPVLAETIRKHRYTAIVHDEDKPRTWEEKLVYYADKRVMHDKIVSLRQRLEDAHRRHAALRQAAGIDDAQIARIDEAIFELEAELFGPTGLDPDAVTSELIDKCGSDP